MEAKRETSPARGACFAEVVESSLHEWQAQSWKWDDFPSFGSLVRSESGNRTLFGIVFQIRTGSMDPSRYPFPYQKTEDELLREQPQIFEFLKTTFSCLPVGYMESDTIAYQICPKPPKIHTFVCRVDQALMHRFFESDEFLYPLISPAQHITNLDELLLAVLQQLAQNRLLTSKKIQNFIDTFSLLTGNDYRRLKTFLGRAQPIVQGLQT